MASISGNALIALSCNACKKSSSIEAVDVVCGIKRTLIKYLHAVSVIFVYNIRDIIIMMLVYILNNFHLGSSSVKASMMKTLAVTRGTHLGEMLASLFSYDVPPKDVISILLNLSSVLLGSSYANGRDDPSFFLAQLSER